MASMEHPLFTLATRPDRRILRYAHGEATIEVTPSVKGLATIHDKDVLIFCVSQLMAALNAGRPTAPTLHLKAHDLLLATNRETSGDGYRRLREAFERLSGTRIVTNIETGGIESTRGFGLIDAWEILRKAKGGRMILVTVTLSDWIYRSVLSKSVLTLHRDYFRLRKPLERRVYEIARKHCGRQAEWRIGLETLLQKSGSTSPRRVFRKMIRDMAEEDGLPDYTLALGDGDLVRVRPRAKPGGRGRGRGSGPQVHERARAAAPGLDPYGSRPSGGASGTPAAGRGSAAPRRPSSPSCAAAPPGPAAARAARNVPRAEHSVDRECGNFAAVATHAGKQGADTRQSRGGLCEMSVSVEAYPGDRRRRLPRQPPLRAAGGARATRCSASTTSSPAGGPTSRTCSTRPGFELMRHDVTFPLYVEVDEIYNLACPASPIHYQFDPVQTTKTSVHGAINMLGLAKRVRAKMFQASTSEVYGDPSGASADRGLLGQRQPDRPALLLRRGQALRRDAVLRLPPPAQAPDQGGADLQHLRAADAPERRAGGVELHRAGAAGASRSPSTATAARPAASATSTT